MAQLQVSNVPGDAAGKWPRMIMMVAMKYRNDNHRLHHTPLVSIIFRFLIQSYVYLYPMDIQILIFIFI